MTTEEFIDALAEQEAIDGELTRQLRAKAREGGHRVTPEAILKFLVKTDVLTAWKGEELSAMLLGASPPTAPRAEEILDLAPIEEDLDERSERRSRSGPTPIDAGVPLPGSGRQPLKAPVDEPLFASSASRGDMPPALDALAVESSGSGSKAPGVYRLGGGKKKSNKKRTAGGANQWDSPLLLLGGGALALLIVAGVLLYYLLFRENAAAVLTDANNLFKAGAYGQAIGRYEEFITRFSSHPDASKAKVQLEMTKLWQSVEAGSDPGTSLELAKQVIAQVEDEQAFISGGEGEEGLSTAKQDLGRLLVRIGEGLVAKAEKSTNQPAIEETIKQIVVVLELSENDKLVPEKFRNAPALASLQQSLEVIRSRQQRDTRLAATLAKMDAAIAGGDTAAAYAERLTLLSEYPALTDEVSLAAKVREVSAAEQARVKFVAGDAAAETSWPPRPVVAELALAERRGAAGAAASGAPVVVRVDGALYGLRSGDGALLWRRFAGLGETAAPLAVDNGGVVAADLGSGELWRLDAATGKLVWRLPLDDKITGVTAVGPRLLATSESGKLYVVDAASGALAGHVEFSQPIRTSPSVNDRSDRIYVAAEHSILYTLSAADYSCVGVYYLGHAAGTIVAPPVTVLNKVVVADNSGTETCRIRVLSLDKAGAIGGEVADARLTGIVVTPLATAARRMAAATTRGQVGVFEIGGANDQTALTIIARRDGQDAEPLARFALLHEGKLWLAATQLMKLTILPTENQLSVESMDNDYQGDAFDAPLQAVGPLLVSVRRPAGRAGAVVAAINAGTNRRAWETEIAVPPAGAPAVDSVRMRVTAATASGAIYVLDRQSLTRGVQDDAVRASVASARALPLTASLDLGEGRLAAGAEGSGSVVLVRPDELRQPVRSIELAAPLSGPLAAWQEGIVCPTDVGQVFLLDIGTGAQAGTPFQPELTPDRKYNWLTPAIAGEGDQSRLLISDGAELLYSIQYVAEPTPHLEAVKSVDVGPSPLASPLAVVGSRVLAGTEDGRLAPFAVPDLTPGEPIKIAGRVAWGPFPAGAGMLLATDAGEVMFVGAEGAIAWRRKLEHGDLAGRPLVADGAALVLHASGSLSRINLMDGAETGFANIGQPAIAGPVPLGERVIVSAPDGALLVVNRP